MKKTTAPQTKKTKKVVAARKNVVQKVQVFEENDGMEDVMTTEVGMQTKTNRVWIVGLALVAVIAFVGYKYNYLLSPAKVNGESIYVWEYFWKLHKQFGNDQINSLSTELMIRQAVKEAKVSVEASAIDAQVKEIEMEASASGGLQALLAAQHLTMDEFRTRIELQLAVKKILADKVVVSDTEVAETLKKNSAFYKDVSETVAKQEIKRQLEDQKFQTAVSAWLSEVRSKAKVSIKFPGLESFTQ